jgi:hypothetical protein
MLGTVWRHIHSILVQMMTSDKRNSQTCPFRVWGTLGFLTLIIFMGLAVFLSAGSNFDPAAYGGAMAAYLIAWGGAIFAKGKIDG